MDSKQIDVLIAEQVMGLSLKPCADVALVAVAKRHIDVWRAGESVVTDTRDDIVFPATSDMRLPGGSVNWSDRCYLYTGEFLVQRYPKIAAEVEAYRLTPEPYSSDFEAAWQVVEKLQAWWSLETPSRHHWRFVDRAPDGWRAEIWFGHQHPHHSDEFIGCAPGETLPEAICRAALDWCAGAWR